MKGGGEARSGGVLDCYMFEQEAAASTAVVSATVTAELPLFPPQQPGAVKGPGIVSQGMWVSEDSRPVVQNSFPDDSDLENGGMALLVNFQPQEHGQFSFKGKTIQVSVELGQGGAVAGPILGHSPSQTEYGTRNESEFSELIKLLEESGSQPLITDLEGQQSIEREGQVFGVAEGASQFVKMLPGQVGQQKETCQLQGFDLAVGASQVLETPSGQVDQQGQGVAGQRMRNEQLVSFTPGQLGHGLGPGSDFLMQNEYVAADQLNGSAQFQESWQGQGVLEVGGASQMIYSGQGQIDQQMPERGGVWTELNEIRGAGQIMDGVAGQKLPGQIILGPDEMGWINQSIGGGPDGQQGQGVVLPGVDKMGGAGQSAGGGPVGQQIPVQVILGQGGVLPGVDELAGWGWSVYCWGSADSRSDDF
ncbi:uncharacterized protein [Littorina saxatilis]|uniref:uncharacterized protein n=1 Tax=Littorina saxatilis TaxID=31220 RepID=UPI0038B45EB7